LPNQSKKVTHIHVKRRITKSNIIIELNLFYRWASIGNMIQFTNAVYGTAVGNWVAGSDMLAFSRSAELTNIV
jgi:hypothetical protein